MPTFDLTTASEKGLVKLCESDHGISQRTTHIARLQANIDRMTDELEAATAGQNECLSQLVSDGGGTPPAAGTTIAIVKDANGPAQLSWF